MKRTYKLLFLLTLSVAFSVKVFAGTYGGGDGSAETPFLISTAAHLQELSTTRADWDQQYHFKLTADIDMTDKDFKPIGYENASRVKIPFRGTIDGDNFRISNLTINSTHDDCHEFSKSVFNIGLIGLSDTCIIKNLGIVDGNIDMYDNTRNAGLIIGLMEKSSISNCFATGINQGETDLGGLVGLAYSSSHIVNCWADVDINGYYTKYAAGIIGESKFSDLNTIDKCAYYGRITKRGVSSPTDCNGINGGDESTTTTITDCYFTDSIANPSGRGVALSLAELKLQASYSGFDFINTWRMSKDGYATLLTFNYAPVADAGLDQNVTEGDLVTLGGGLSYDMDGDSLSFTWESLSTEIVLSDFSTVSPTFTAPEVDDETSFTFKLIVNDGFIDSEIDEVLVTVFPPGNVPPVANAGVDQEVNGGDLVTLDASASGDADGDTLAYSWIAPVGIVLSDSTAIKPTFTAPEKDSDMLYSFILTVNDGTVSSAPDTIVVTAKFVNAVPMADAGTPQTVDELTLVTLDGSASYDVDGDSLLFMWTAPEGITLSDSTAVKPTFMAPDIYIKADYQFSLAVSDGYEESEISKVFITVIDNRPPTADAGSNQTIDEKSLVTLDGSASSDPEGADLTYSWTAPEGITLSDATAAKPTFTAPSVAVDNDYEFTLVVNDGANDSEAAAVTITVKDLVSVNTNDAMQLSVYPNPSNGSFTLKVPEQGNLMVIDLMGKSVLTTQVFAGENHINLSAYESGIYLLRLEMDKKLSVIKVQVNN